MTEAAIGATTADVHNLSLDFYRLADLRRLIEEPPRLGLDPAVQAKIRAGHDFVLRKAAEDRYIYGVNTGFGSLCETRVRPDELETLQRNHVVSHAVGVGEPVPERIARLTLLIKLLTFRTGHTGISLGPVNRLVEFWNRGVIPSIPKKGTVGASGDLAPLAHMALPLLGLGKVHADGGGIVDARDVLRRHGWEPMRLGPKEGLALTNGVQYLNAMAVDALLRLEELIKAADVLAALSCQAFSGSETFYHPSYHQTAHHQERRDVAANLSRLLEGSNHHELPTCNHSKQDPYSFRCLPQVHAAVRQTFGFAREVIEQQCNSVSDNPLFFPDQDLILFGGNLHGQSTAVVLDYLAIATTVLSNISERRTYQLLSGERGLPDFLVHRPGVNSGLMIAQYTSAALVNENKVLSTPASVDTIPTCQLQEDHVSMGGTAGYKLGTILDNCEYIFGIEMLCAAQAIELNKALRLSPLTKRIFEDFRRHVRFLDADRVIADDINAAHRYVLEHKGAWAAELGLN